MKKFTLFVLTVLLVKFSASQYGKRGFLDILDMYDTNDNCSDYELAKLLVKKGIQMREKNALSLIRVDKEYEFKYKCQLFDELRKKCAGNFMRSFCDNGEVESATLTIARCMDISMSAALKLQCIQRYKDYILATKCDLYKCMRDLLQQNCSEQNVTIAFDAILQRHTRSTLAEHCAVNENVAVFSTLPPPFADWENETMNATSLEEAFGNDTALFNDTAFPEEKQFKVDNNHDKNETACQREFDYEKNKDYKCVVNQLQHFGLSTKIIAREFAEAASSADEELISLEFACYNSTDIFANATCRSDCATHILRSIREAICFDSRLNTDVHEVLKCIKSRNHAVDDAITECKKFNECKNQNERVKCITDKWRTAQQSNNSSSEFCLEEVTFALKTIYHASINVSTPHPLLKLLGFNVHDCGDTASFVVPPADDALITEVDPPPEFDNIGRDREYLTVLALALLILLGLITTFTIFYITKKYCCESKRGNYDFLPYTETTTTY